MKTTFTRCLSLLLCFLLIFFVALTLFFSEISKTMYVSASEQTKMTSINTSSTENQRLLTLTERYIDVNMGENLTIDNTKSLQDFDHNLYTLFELAPIGYIIYHNESGKYVEYSESSYSPYLNYIENLYYGGAMQYYVESGDTLVHTLKPDTLISKVDMDTLARYSEKMSQELTENPDVSNIEYINGSETECVIPGIRGTVKSSAPITAKISMSNFFPNLRTPSQIGYRNGGVCGYIAGAMILAYSYFAFDSGIITNSSYINAATRTLNGPGLTNRLLALNGQNPSSTSFDGTAGADLMRIVINYLNTVPNTLRWTSSWRILAIDAMATLDKGYPVALFGSLPQLTSNNKVNHAVVAYDYQTYGFLNMGVKYRVHYGWSGYSSVWLDSPVVGTVMFLTATN